MDLITTIITLVHIWSQYGGDITKAEQVIAELQKLDNGAVLADVEAIFIKFAVGLGELVNFFAELSGTPVPNPTPAPDPSPVDPDVIGGDNVKNHHGETPDTPIA